MKKFFMFLSAAFLFCLISCNEKASGRMGKTMAVNGSIASSKMTAAPVMFDAVEESTEVNYEGNPEASASDYERKLIKTASITLEVDNFDSADLTIKNFAEAFGGYVTNTNKNDYSYGATVKIPCEYFDKALEASEQIGKVKYSSQNSEDVTEDFYDLKTRIETKEILKNKLENYLTQAKDMKDLLEIEKQLNDVISELESMEGRMKRLNNQISYSTIYINLQLPAGYDNSGYNWPDLGEDFRELGVNTLNFLSGFLMVIVYAVIYGIPVIAVIALLYWLLFGRIGLLLKLFRFLSRKRESHDGN